MWLCPCLCCRPRRVKNPALLVGREAEAPGPGRQRKRARWHPRGSLPATVHRVDVGRGAEGGGLLWTLDDRRAALIKASLQSQWLAFSELRLRA